MNVATFIDADDVRELRREWDAMTFADVTVYVWSQVPFLVRRLAKLVGVGP